ncbi:hypothetical protein BDY24DRAFT_23436 [Mrakia frigida]|uniref:RING-H2 finger protein n=1 Tax=Mrakia frigida TaxID=29902 RepID=UPI003FCC181B
MREATYQPGLPSSSKDSSKPLLLPDLNLKRPRRLQSLLSPPPPPNTANASGAAAPRLATSTIDSIRQRIARVRSRSPATAPSTTAPAGIEQILRDYMSTNINPTGSGSAGGGSTSTTATIPVGAGAEAAAASTEPVVPPELGSFEAFLADLQVDLVRALREYNGFPPAGQEGPARAAPTEEAGSSEGSTEEGAVPEASEPGEGGGAAGEGATGEEEQARAAAVGGGGTGLGVEPRRLNWMRVYRFPPRNVQGTLAADRAPSNDSVDDAASIPSDGASTSESTLSADPANASEQAPAPPAPTRLRDTSVTPMIMVRSISRADVAEAFGGARPANPPPPTATRRASSSSLPSSSSSTDPSSPASNLNTLPGSSTSLDQDGDAVMDEALPTSSTTGGPPPSASNLGRLRQAMRGIRDRRRGENGTEEEAAAQPTGERAGTRSFVLWVVGGLYSSDHPLLTAPGLFGGTLDHDDLWALAELLGQVKPPTASSEAIANSGLEIIKGAMVKGWCEEKKVLENSADRCMVCLGDYEEEEDCRILECKHVFHQECIDKWLHVGRNACPACRSPGVKAAEPAQAPTPTPTPATPPISTTSATTAASTDEASSSSTPVV